MHGNEEKFTVEGIAKELEGMRKQRMPLINYHYRKRIKFLLSHIYQLEIQLAEAQQWIDSEPDWKDKYMERYKALQAENKKFQAIVNAIDEASDKGAVTPGFWGKVAARQTIKADKLEERGRKFEDEFIKIFQFLKGLEKTRIIFEKSPIDYGVKEILKELHVFIISNCTHFHTHNEDWPDGGGIIVCDDCGMSKYVWEQGEGSWQWIEDIPKARKELEEAIRELPRKV